jgi:hypothetical protein
MSRTIKNLVFKVAAYIAAFLIVTAPAFAALIDGKIQVGNVRGGVQVIDAEGERRELKAGDILEVFDRVQFITNAKGTASLWLQNGMRIIVRPNSDFIVLSLKISDEVQIPAESFDKLNGEPSNSKVNLWLAYGTVLTETRDLKLPISDLTITSPFVRVKTILPKAPEPRPPAYSFMLEQQDEYAKVASAKGLVHVWPQYEDLGPEVDVPQDKTAVFRRKRPVAWEGIDENLLRELSTTDSQVDYPIPLVPSNPNGNDPNDPLDPNNNIEDPIDVTVIDPGGEIGGDGETPDEPRRPDKVEPDYSGERKVGYSR